MKNGYKRQKRVAELKSQIDPVLTWAQIAETMGVSESVCKKLYAKWQDLIERYGGPLNAWQESLPTSICNALNAMGINTPGALDEYITINGLRSAEDVAKSIPGLGVKGLDAAMDAGGLDANELFGMVEKNPFEGMDMHPSTRELVRWLENEHLPAGPVRAVSGEFKSLAATLLGKYQVSGPEVSAGLRKLVEAKDCFVRAVIAGGE
jgi:hypothetical protein